MQHTTIERVCHLLPSQVCRSACVCPGVDKYVHCYRTGGISDFSYEHSETKRVYVRAEQSDNSSSISSQATRFSTALAEVYQAHSQEVTG